MNLYKFLKSFKSGIGKRCTRTPAPQAASIHHICAAGGEGSFTTMAVMFVM